MRIKEYEVKPLVSVYFISAYRHDYLERALKSFLKSTKYQKLEIIIVDSSVGEFGEVTRSWLAGINGKLVDKVIYRDKVYCVWSNANEGFKATTGEFIIQLEDDIIFKEDIPVDWIERSIDLFDSNLKLGAVNLASANILDPLSLGFIAPRAVCDAWFPWDCFPSEFQTVSDSMKSGDRMRLNKFKKLNLECRGEHYINTSFSAPSVSMIKLQDEKKMSPEQVEEMRDNGFRVVRDRKIFYISIDEYRRKGGYKSFNLALYQYEYVSNNPSSNKEIGVGGDRGEFAIIKKEVLYSRFSVFKTRIKILIRKNGYLVKSFLLHIIQLVQKKNWP